MLNETRSLRTDHSAHLEWYDSLATDAEDSTSLYILYKFGPDGQRKYLRHVIDDNQTEVGSLTLGQTYRF